jgi:hypothetical protein
MSYIGNDLRSGRSETYVFTASGAETTVTASDDSRAINYTVGWERVWLNGVLLVGGSGNDYQATTGNSITGLAALSVNDILVLEANHTFSVSDSVPRSGGTFDGGVTFGDTIVQTTSKNITGTLTENALYLSNAFVMTGNITVSGKSTLARISDDDATTPLLTDDGTERTITGAGTLTLGTLVQ